MEFPYYIVADFPKHQKRVRKLPWIRFGIYNPENESKILYLVGLIDSGADLTIIHREFGEELGFNIEKGKKINMVGLGGAIVKGYLHTVGFKISDIKEKEKPITYIDFAVFTSREFPTSNPQQTAILGTQGFFNHIQICFDYPERIFIEPQ